MPAVLWRQPRAAHAQAVAALDLPQTIAALDFRRGEPGFVLAPFSDAQPSLFVPAHLSLTEAGVEAAQSLAPSRRARADLFLRRYAQMLARGPLRTERWAWASAAENERHLSQPEFEALVADAVRFIHVAGIAKVVVSRTAPVALPPGFDPHAMFAALCDNYPHAFVSLVTLPSVGTWIGASPELLLAVDQTSVRTMALAGTQRLPEAGFEGADLSHVHWGNKEIVEQEMVSEYVRGFFHEAGLRDIIEEGPHTVAAGRVAHLRTTFEARLPEEQRLQLANRVLSQLHPTSAVCGMPRREALAFILAREGYDRGFYSGYLGPVHMGGESTLYVNLRCMQLRRTHANLYMGAGITAASDPASEWRETELKAHTILDVLAEVAPVQPARR